MITPTRTLYVSIDELIEVLYNSKDMMVQLRGGSLRKGGETQLEISNIRVSSLMIMSNPRSKP